MNWSSQKLITLSIFTLFFVQIISAQAPRHCAHESKTEAATQQAYSEFLKMTLAEKKAYLQSHKNGQAEFSSIVTIPVHVVIVHAPGEPVGTGDNLSLAHIESQIDVLNEDFRRLNADTTNTPPGFSVADSEIEFCMASVDPDGDPTDGVTRYATNLNLNTDEFAIKSATTWDRDQYLNMYVGPDIGYLGWAYFATPTSLPNPVYDGIVVATSAFGGPGFAWGAPYDLGRTATHEIGHYLGLPHVWGGGCSSDDGFADTPNQSGPNWGCPNHPSPSCGNSGDMFCNYMDYVDDDCMNSFSVDQADWMNLILNTSRSSLLTAANTVCNIAPPALGVNIIQTTDLLCAEGSDGLIEVEGTGGIPPYEYAVNGGIFQSDGLFENLSAGTHTIDIQDGNGTIVSIDITLTEPPSLISEVSQQGDVSCFELEDGYFLTDTYGGTPFTGGVYEYSLNGGPYTNQSEFFDLPAGIYYVDVRDANDCHFMAGAQIFQPNELIIETDELINVDCYGNENGSAQFYVEGGTQNYQFSIDGNTYQDENIFENLSPNQYTASVLDFNDCLAEIEFEIEEPDSLELLIGDQTDLLCHGDSTATVTLSTLGGTAEFEFSADSSAYQTDSLFENLSAGTYTFYVKDLNECEAKLSLEITQPDLLELELSAQNIIPCVGDETGEFTLEASGGTPDFTYTLPDGTTNNDGYFSNLAAGIYEAEVEDINQCKTTIEIEVTEMPELILDILAQTDASCHGGNDGTIFVEGTGGNGNYQYSTDGIIYFSSGNFEGLSASNYAVFVKDAEGCLSEMNVDISEPTMIETSLISSTNPDCFEGNSGSLAVTATGGTGGFQFTLGNETNSTGIFENLTAGIYDIEIKDENDCVQMIQTTLTEPTEVQGEIVALNNAGCAGATEGSIEVLGSGGTGNFEYTLGNETNSTGLFENLGEGDYNIEISDENNCKTTLSATIDGGSEITFETAQTSDVLCHGEADGTVQLNASGGTGDFEFSLNNEMNTTGFFQNLPAGDYSATATDSEGCAETFTFTISEPEPLTAVVQNIENPLCHGDSTASFQVAATGGVGSPQFELLNGMTNETGLFENLPAGDYEVIIIDENGCQTITQTTVFEPTEIAVTGFDRTDVSCFGGNDGSFQIETIGGTGTHTFTLGNETNSTGMFENLPAGIHSVLVQDENGCGGEALIEIVQPDQLAVDITSIQHVNCAGGNTGSFEIIAEGGVGNYQFEANGEINSTGIFENLSEGTYDVLIWDGNNCQTGAQVTIIQNPELTAQIVTSSNVLCHGEANGMVVVSAGGGAGNYTYSIDNETNTTGVFENLSTGTYDILVTDEADCETVLQIEITEPMPLNSELLEIQDVDCFGNSTGLISVEAMGGTPVYEYTIGATVNDSGLFENLPAGDYTVLITDQNGCETTLETEILTPDELVLDTTDIQNDNGSGNGSFILLATGGTPPYVSNPSAPFENLTAGFYTVEVKDANGCTKEITVEIKLETAVFDPESGIEYLEVLPNPFTDQIFVKMNLSVGQDFEMTLFNMQGQAVEFFEAKVQDGEHFLRFDLERDLPAGTYVLGIWTRTGRYFFKLVKN